jgi:hypothetical protein
MLTRTIWVSCFPLFLKKRDRSSHFLLLLLLPRQFCNGSCTRTPAFAATFTSFRRPKKATAVEARICLQLKSCTVINYCLRDSLYRDTAPVPPTDFVTGDKFAAPIKLVPPLLLYKSGAGATLVMLNIICTRTAKTRAIPSLHRDSFLAKVPGPYPDAASGNSHRCRQAPSLK